ncbi:hypothetical protein ACFX2I_024225 [Malus domestica]
MNKSNPARDLDEDDVVKAAEATVKAAQATVKAIEIAIDEASAPLLTSEPLQLDSRPLSAFSPPLASLYQYSLGALILTFAGFVGDLELAAVSIENSVIAGLTFGVILGVGSALEMLCGQTYGAGLWVCTLKDDDQGQKMWRINQRIVKLIVELMRIHDSPESLVILSKCLKIYFCVPLMGCLLMEKLAPYLNWSYWKQQLEQFSLC